jgi:hypothetical protein
MAAVGGSSSPEAPEESLKNFCLRVGTFGSGGVAKVVETVSFGGTSPVGVWGRGTRGLELFGASGVSNLETALEFVGELGTD